MIRFTLRPLQLLVMICVAACSEAPPRSENAQMPPPASSNATARAPESARPQEGPQTEERAREVQQLLKTSTNPHIQPYATILRDAIWLQRDKIIYVCWENVDPAQSNDAAKVRDAVTSTWQKNSALTFQGWQRCADRSRGVRIRVEDSGPHTKGLGRQLERDGFAIDAGMVLNFTFNNWSPSCRDTHDFCIKSIGVHEFGHAIGFAHEHNRHDRPGDCRERPQGTTGDVLLTPYDPHSVMNYCNPKYNNGGILSALDIAAVQQIYGPPSVR